MTKENSAKKGERDQHTRHIILRWKNEKVIIQSGDGSRSAVNLQQELTWVGSYKERGDNSHQMARSSSSRSYEKPGASDRNQGCGLCDCHR